MIPLLMRFNRFLSFFIVPTNAFFLLHLHATKKRVETSSIKIIIHTNNYFTSYGFGPADRLVSYI